MTKQTIEIFIDEMDYPKYTFYEAMITKQQVTDDEIRISVHHNEGKSEIFLKAFSYQIVCHTDKRKN